MHVIRPLSVALVTCALVVGVSGIPLLAHPVHQTIPDANHGCRERKNLVSCPSHIMFKTRNQTRDIDLTADPFFLTSIAEQDNCQAIATITLVSLNNGVAINRTTPTGQVGSCLASFSGMAGTKPVGKVKVKIAFAPG